MPALVAHRTSKGPCLSVSATKHKTPANILNFITSVGSEKASLLPLEKPFLSDFEKSNCVFGSEGSVKVKPGLITPVGKGQKNGIFARVMHIAHHSIIFV